MVPGRIVIPSQIIDYTYSRDHTFFEDDDNVAQHIDFRHPYSQDLRTLFIETANESEIKVTEEATYGAIQGPRFPTLAEINRLEQDGCDVVGMSGMPETILARELDLEYATIALVTQKAAGRITGHSASTQDVATQLQESLSSLHTLIEKIILRLE